MDISQESLKSKITYSFNKIALGLLNDLKESNDEIKKCLKKKYKVFDKLSSEHMNRFNTQMKELKEFIVDEKTTVEDIFKNESFLETHILKGVQTSVVFEKLSEDKHYEFLSQVYLMSLFSHVRGELTEDNDEEMETVFKRILELANTPTILFEETDDIVDDDIKNLVTRYHSCKTKSIAMRIGDTEESGIMDMFQGSKIGELAKEISQEIDISKIGNPQDLLNFSDPNNTTMQDIIKKVGSKIQNKMDKGQLNQEDLVSEAMSLVGQLGGGASGSSGNILADVMGAASSMGLGGGNIAGNPAMRKMTTKERLRKKLEDKKLKNGNK